MNTTTIPAVGDTFTYATIVTKADYWYSQGKEAGHRRNGHIKTDTGDMRFTRECDPRGERACPKCFNQWQIRTSTVTDVRYFADNSSEVTLADGTRRTVDGPSGDVCF